MTRTKFFERWISEATEETGCQVIELTGAEADSVRGRLQKYVNPDLTGFRLWEFVEPRGSLIDLKGWELVSRYPYVGKVVLFFNDRDHTSMYWISNVRDVVKFVGHMPRVDFYVADPNGDFLIAYNQYDILIGAGNAQAWVEGLRSG